MALGVSVSLIFVCGAGLSCQRAAVAPKRHALIAVARDNQLSVLDTEGEVLHTQSLDHVPDLIGCARDEIYVASAGSVGRFRAGQGVSWYELPALGPACEGQGSEVVAFGKFADSRVCFVVADGPPDISSCSQSVVFDGASQFRRVEECSVSVQMLPVTSGDGRWVVSPEGDVQGDYSYFQAVVLSDKESGRTVRLEGPVRVDRLGVQWAGRWLLVAGRVIELPSMTIRAEGELACIIRGSG